MKRKQLLITFLAASVALASCKKKSSEGEAGSDDPFQLEYSNLSVEENKKEIEKSGLEFVKEFNTLPDEKFIDVLDYFSTLNLDGVDMEVNGVNNVLTISQASAKKDLKKIFTSAVSETSKLSDYFAIYTWSRSKEKFEKTASSNKIEFLFPSDATKINNDASLTFTYQAGITATIDGEKIELPKNSSVVLKVGSKEELKLVTSHEYKTDGTPTKTDLALTLGAFSINSGVSNDGVNASSTFSLKKGAKTLLSANLSGEGKTTISAIDREEEDIIKNANATFQVMNLKLMGIANVKAIIDGVNAISGTNEEENGNKEASLWNQHSQFVAINTSSNSLIAKTEFVSIYNPNCYTYYDYYLQKYIEYCYSYYNIEPRLVFKDGSKQSLDAFTESGFSGVIDEMEDLMDKF